MNEPLTPRQRQILRLIAEGARRGKTPTVRELVRLTGVASPNGVSCHLKALQKKGFIERDAMTARNIRLAGASTVLAYHEGEAGRRLRAELEGE